MQGRVLDARGRPVAGATVRLGPDLPTRTTGRDGRFAWDEVPPGSYTAHVSVPGAADRTLPLVLGRGMTLEVQVR